MTRTLRGLIVPDTHVPFHDPVAWPLMVKAGRAWRPDIVVLLGDFMDFYQLSRYSKDPDIMSSVEADCEVGVELLCELEDLGAEEYHYLEGNHEERLKKYVNEYCPQLKGLVDLEKLLQLEGWNVTPYGQGIDLGHCYFTHDLGRHGMRAVEQARVESETNVVIGHLHKMQSVYAGNAFGTPKFGQCVGWLGDPKKVGYKHRRKALRDYQHGFGTFLLEPDGRIFVNGHPIVNGGVRLGERVITL